MSSPSTPAKATSKRHAPAGVATPTHKRRAVEHPNPPPPDVDPIDFVNLEFLYLNDGSGVVTTPDADRLVFAMTGSPLVKERQRIIYETNGDSDPDLDPLNVFSIK